MNDDCIPSSNVGSPFNVSLIKPLGSYSVAFNPSLRPYTTHSLQWYERKHRNFKQAGSVRNAVWTQNDIVYCAIEFGTLWVKLGPLHIPEMRNTVHCFVLLYCSY
jgi:hypothetical protein